MFYIIHIKTISKINMCCFLKVQIILIYKKILDAFYLSNCLILWLNNSIFTPVFQLFILYFCTKWIQINCVEGTEDRQSCYLLSVLLLIVLSQGKNRNCSQYHKMKRENHNNSAQLSRLPLARWISWVHTSDNSYRGKMILVPWRPELPDTTRKQTKGLRPSGHTHTCTHTQKHSWHRKEKCLHAMKNLRNWIQ